MLKSRLALFSFIRAIIDFSIIVASWLIVYPLRFNLGVLDNSKGVPDFKRHLILTLPILAICFVSFKLTKLYEPKRVRNFFFMWVDLLKSVLFSCLLIFSLFYFIGDVPYSRKLLTRFCVVLLFGLSADHILLMSVIRLFRKKGYNQRYFAVIGTTSRALSLVEDVETLAWLGLKCAFFIDENPVEDGKKIFGRPVYGPLEKLVEKASQHGVDEVYLAIEGQGSKKAYPMLESLQLEGCKVRILPDWGNLVYMGNPVTTQIGSQVLFSAGDSPLSDKNLLLKRGFDIIGSLALLAVMSIPMLVIALMVKLTSNGPIFYRQVRLGYNQCKFVMLKFRTMTRDVEGTAPSWTTANDNRRTAFGKWLRKLSLDELPQLFNVLKGDMSLVGPRPEQPSFAKNFSEEYKRYMLRHNVKAGITGWAQINGYRGDTSLKKRLLYDLYYIRNWSFAFDLWILIRTPIHTIKGENAY